MDYSFNGSSNSVKPGTPVNMEIIISRESLDKIRLIGSFSIENLENIVSQTNLPDLNCELFGKSPDEKVATNPVRIASLMSVPGAPGRKYVILPRNKFFEYTYLVVKIYNANCSWPSPIDTTTLNIGFSDENRNSQHPVKLPFTVFKKIAKLEIISFNADPAVIQGDSGQKVSLTWEIAGDSYTYKIQEGFSDIPVGSATGTIDNPLILDNIRIGDHAYTLIVKQNDSAVTATKSIFVRALDRPQCYRVNNPSPFELIGNICIANDSSCIFSLIINKNDTRIQCIGYSTEGFSGNWQRITLTNSDKDQLKPFAFSPVIHLKNTGQALGRLIFIGGSVVKTKEASNSVAIVDLEVDELTDRVTINPREYARPWPARMAHNCIMFPHGGTDKIWLMGGQDEWGATLNDIWVSENGIQWNNIDANGTVVTGPQPVIPWKPRCFFGASVQLSDAGKQALWVGGGYSETGGKETSDMWIWDKTKWSQVQNDVQQALKINNGSYLSSALAFIGKDTVDSSGMYVFGGYSPDSGKATYFLKISKQASIYGMVKIGGSDSSSGSLYELTTTKDANVSTGYFKGCLWYIAFTNEGDTGITISHLYYWVPPVGSETVILS